MERWRKQKLWSHSGEEERKISLKNFFSLIWFLWWGSFLSSMASSVLLSLTVSQFCSNSHSPFFSLPQAWSGLWQQTSNIFSVSTFLLTCAKQPPHYIFLRKLFKSRTKVFPKCFRCSIQSPTSTGGRIIKEHHWRNQACPKEIAD